MATAAGKPNPAALERRHQGQLPTAAASAAGQGLNAAAPFLFCVSASVGATAAADRAVTQSAAPADIIDREVGDATHVRQSLRPSSSRPRVRRRARRRRSSRECGEAQPGNALRSPAVRRERERDRLRLG